MNSPMNTPFRIRFSVFIATVLAAGSALALWSDSASVGDPVVVWNDVQNNPAAVSDGAGGVIVAWQDARSGADNDIYAQRVTATGPQWTAGGIPVVTLAQDQANPAAVSDGAGGVIIGWQDFRSGADNDIHAQRLDSDGNALWTANGVLVTGAISHQELPKMIADGAGGAILAWRDSRGGVTSDIYAQRLDADGNPLWTADGVAVCAAAGDQDKPVLVSDGAGGAVVAWTDLRGADRDIYAQRLDADGNPLWAADGVAVCAAAGDQDLPAMVPDGAGRAIVAWQDYRNGGDNDVYAQRMNPVGAADWAANGIALSAAAGDQQSPILVSDGAGGAIAAWQDYRSGANNDIYAQRVNTSGDVLWTAGGVAVSAAAGEQRNPAGISDGAGGAIIAWRDARSGADDIYARKIGADGAAAWTADGNAVGSAAGNQQAPALVPDGAEGAIAVWEDLRSGTEDIYAARIHASGLLGSPPPAPSGLSAAADSDTRVNLSWTDNSTDETGFRIERSSDNITFTADGTTAAGDTTYTSPNLSPSTATYFRVAAYNGKGDSSPTAVANALTRPSAPTGLTATAASDSAVNLAWTNGSAHDGLHVERSTGGDYSEIAAPDADITTFADTGLSPSTTYTYRLRAHNASGFSAYSTVSDATTDNIPTVGTGTGTGSGGGCFISLLKKQK
ncbi:MAG: fibronectin type III domain-containing protein [Planctomycetota bacterium]